MKQCNTSPTPLVPKKFGCKFRLLWMDFEAKQRFNASIINEEKGLTQVQHTQSTFPSFGNTFI